MRRIKFAGFALAAVLLAGSCDAVFGPREDRVEQMQVSAHLSARAASFTGANDSVVVWIRVRNPLPYAVTLGTVDDYPWWTISIGPEADEYMGMTSLVNPRRPLHLAAGADTVHPHVIRLSDFASLFPPGEYLVRAGLEYTLSSAQRLRLER